MSNFTSAHCSKNTSMPDGLVNTSHWYVSICAKARNRSVPFIGQICMDGNSNTSAPRLRNFSASLCIRCFGRVRTTLVPAKGSLSYQPKSSASAQTFPISRIAGVGSFSFSILPGSSETVEISLCCPAVVPWDKSAAGICGFIPAAISP